MLDTIQVALESHLNTLDPKPLIAWPNVPTTPVTTEPYFEPKLRPMALDDDALDRKGYMRQRVLWTVEVFVPKGQGTHTLRSWLKALEAHFPRDLVLTVDDVEVKFRTCARNTPVVLDTWYVQGIDFYVYAISR